MQRLIILSSIVCLASAYGGHGDYSGSQGGGGHSGGHSGGHAVAAAVISHHNIKHYDVPSSGHIYPTTIDVPSYGIPITFIFRSSSSHINVVAKHNGAGGSHKETSSQDEPHYLMHTVTKPIIQEVREIITPSRFIQQTVEPVREQISTVVARNSGGAAGGIGGGGGFGNGGQVGAGVGAAFGLTGLGDNFGKGASNGGYGQSLGHQGPVGHGLSFKKDYYKSKAAASA